MIKGIAVQTAQLKGNQNALLSFDDVCGMVEFGLALGCQISEAEKGSALISLTPKWFPVQPSSQSQHTCPPPCPLC